jgi:pre-mRNA 3'-end-processing factor FIP1
MGSRFPLAKHVADKRNSTQAARQFKFERPSQNSAPITIRSPPPPTSKEKDLETSSKAHISLKSGKDFPVYRTSTIDVNADPMYPPVGKPITEVEIDADLAEHEKPWRRPGADPSDYFNYGFDEFTWSTYCMRQGTMKDNLKEQKEENASFQAMIGGFGMAEGMPAGMPGGLPAAGAGAGMPSMSAMPPVMPSMPGIDAQMQQAMQQAMMQQGVSDPSQIDINMVMSIMNGGASGQMVGNVPSGPSAQQQQNWQGNQQGGYGRGGKRGGGRWQ